jgi:protein-L-isoaspartate(D-aspartate) O-methyltransferase
VNRSRGLAQMRQTSRSQVLFLIGAAILVAGWWGLQLLPRRPQPAADRPPAAVKEGSHVGEGSPTVDAMASMRQSMVDQLRGRDITDERVLATMLRVPRHEFVPLHSRNEAYEDGPLPIGHGQTISQPYIVALMTQLVRPKPNERALDVGTGSGYQAAVLAELTQEVYSIEIVCPLADEASARLMSLGYENVTVRCGDGYVGWKEHAPFDVIVVAAAAGHVPKPLIDQLAPGGRMVIPVGDFSQDLRLIEKSSDGSLRETTVAPVRFVPMTGKARAARGKSEP